MSDDINTEFFRYMADQTHSHLTPEEAFQGFVLDKLSDLQTMLRNALEVLSKN